MNYRIIWSKRAEDDLAILWLNTANQTLISSVSQFLDVQLMRTPLTVGESRESSVNRVIYQDPLGLVYDVIEDDKSVIVQAVFGMKR